MMIANCTCRASRLALCLTFVVTLFGSASPVGAVENVIYFHNDANGSPIAATDEFGQVVWQESYEPFGDRRLESRSAQEQPLWFTGKSEEPELGLQYFGARWYMADVGRFTTVDPAGVNPANPTSFNRYAYANNNPYRFIDPDGRNANPALGGLLYETNQFITGNGFDGQRIAGAFVDGYDGAGSGVGAAIVEDLLSFGGGVASVGVKLGGRVVLKLGKGASTFTKGVGKSPDRAPDFIVSPGGTAFPVPKGAAGPTPVVNPGGKTTGSAFTGGQGGSNGQVDTMRIMDPTPPHGNSPGYPKGYVKYENKSGQGVDPYSGRTLSNKDSHFPKD